MHSSFLGSLLFIYLFIFLLLSPDCFWFFFSWNIGFQELDFLTEAKNNEKCLENFRKFSPHIANYVYAPKVYWNLSTSKLLTMEFMDGVQISDVKTIRRLGIHPHEVSKLVSSCLWASLYIFELSISRVRAYGPSKV